MKVIPVVLGALGNGNKPISKQDWETRTSENSTTWNSWDYKKNYVNVTGLKKLTGPLVISYDLFLGLLFSISTKDHLYSALSLTSSKVLIACASCSHLCCIALENKLFRPG